MLFPKPRKDETSAIPTALKNMAALEEHTRLQQSQEEFLLWLELAERKANDDHDGYNYKQIR